MLPVNAEKCVIFRVLFMAVFISATIVVVMISNMNRVAPSNIQGNLNFFVFGTFSGKERRSDRIP